MEQRDKEKQAEEEAKEAEAKKRYTLNDIIKEVYRELYPAPKSEGKAKSESKSEPESKPESGAIANKGFDNFRKDMRGYFKNFCTLFGIPIELLKEKNYQFSARNKNVLVWLLANYTQGSIKKIRKGQIGMEEFDVYRRIVDGAREILEDANLPKESFEEHLQRLHERIGYYDVLCETILQEIRKVLPLNNIQLTQADKLQWLEWVYTAVLERIKTVARYMEDFRREEIWRIAEERSSSSVDDNIEISAEEKIQKELDANPKYQALMKKLAEIEQPKGNKHSRQITKKEKRAESTRQDMEEINASASMKYQSELEIAKADNQKVDGLLTQLKSSKELLRDAIYEANKDLLQTLPRIPIDEAKKGLL